MSTYSPKQRIAFRLATSLAFDFDCYLIGRIGDWKRKAGAKRIPVAAFRYMQKKLEGQTLVMTSSNQVILALRYCTSGIALVDGKIVYRGDPNECLELVREYRKDQIQAQINEISAPDSDEANIEEEDGFAESITL